VADIPPLAEDLVADIPPLAEDLADRRLASLRVNMLSNVMREVPLYIGWYRFDIGTPNLSQEQLISGSRNADFLFRLIDFRILLDTVGCKSLMSIS
jgi:hypothetical protein